MELSQEFQRALEQELARIRGQGRATEQAAGAHLQRLQRTIKDLADEADALVVSARMIQQQEFNTAFRLEPDQAGRIMLERAEKKVGVAAAHLGRAVDNLIWAESQIKNFKRRSGPR